MQSAIRTLSVVAVLIGGGAACQTTPRIPGRNVEVVSSGGLEALNPTDIAVVPVEVATAGINPPVAILRRAAMNGLVRRRYTPLSAESVDSRIADAESVAEGPIEASYVPGDLAEDAVLEVSVHRWDARSWDIRRVVDVGIDARLVDPRDPLGPVLWEGRIEREFRFGSEGAIRSSGDRALAAACDEIFAELFSQLPARDTSVTLDLPPGSDG